MYLNKVTLYGNLTRDPELKSTTGGTAVASFGLATSRAFKKDDRQQEQTEFHNVVAFGRTGEVMAQYLKKGRPVYIEGRLQTRTWDKDGVKMSRTEVIVDSFQFGPSSERGEERPATPQRIPNTNTEYPDEEINPEDIPF